jgi:hypothetical protein
LLEMELSKIPDLQNNSLKLWEKNIKNIGYP